MLKKFTDGLVFGAGFAIAYIVVWFAASYLIFPYTFSSQMEKVAKEIPELRSEPGPSESTSRQIRPAPGPEFHDLGIDDQIKQASVIALARFERAPDGRMKAVITEFLKKEPGVTIYYDIGDEYPSASRYPKGAVNYGDGEVIFFTGSPARMKMSMSYSGDRIHALADLPVELMRNKCKDPKASAGKN